VKFLLLSQGGDGSGLALRLKEEGHDARIWIREAECDRRCHGLVDTASEYSFGQTIIADCTGAGPLLDTYRDGGVPTVGGSSFCDKLESDRKFSEAIFKQAGIATPKSLRVASWDDAAKAIKKLGGDSGRVVLKPEGHSSGVIPSYVSYDAEDALKMLEHFHALIGGDEVELLIQEFIKGVAISTEGWFNGEEWCAGMFNHTIERKQFLNDDLGPSGGCTGNLVWACSGKDPLVKELLLPITPLLQEKVYRGAIDVNAVVNEEGCYALEFTPRMGYDAFPTLLTALCDFNFGVFLDSLARGYACSETLRSGFAAGVRLTIPPWPSEEFHAKERVPIAGLSPADRRWFYPEDVQLNESGELESSGGYGILGVVNGHGQSITGAFADAYRILTGLRLPNKQYRTDLAEACLKDFRELARVMGDLDGSWIGVDLDGTLAEYYRYSENIGQPIPKMVSRVRRWVGDGKEVRVMTARGAAGDERFTQIRKIHDWLNEHVGHPLEITAQKDPEMIQLWDDRVTQVEKNEGTRVA
jgi:phosphoribosylamine-glycine ligase